MQLLPRATLAVVVASISIGCAKGDWARSNGIDALETPSLRFVGKSAPYFHDGRFKTLRQLLLAKDTKMGSTKHLDPSDVDALATYLETL